MDIGITYTDYYIPESTKKVDELLNKTDLLYDTEKYQTKNQYIEKIKNIFSCQDIPIEEHKSLYQLLEGVLAKYFEIFPRKKIDMIIFSGDFIINESIGITTHRVLYEFKLEKTLVFQCLNNCCGFLTALQVAKSLMLTNKSINTSLIVSIGYPQKLTQRFVSNAGMRGDAIGLVAIERSETNKIKNLSFNSDGKFYNLFFGGDDNVDINKYYRYIKLGVKCIQSLMDEYNLNSNNLDQLIVQNTNKLIPYVLSKHLDLPEKRIFMENFIKHAYLGDPDLIVNFKDYLNKKQESNNIILFSYAVGVSANAIIISNAKYC